MSKQKTVTKPNITPSRKALLPENREKQIGALGYDLLEQRLRDGTATGSEILWAVKNVSMREQLERELMEEKRKVAAAKAEAYESYKRQEELYAKAIGAFRHYNGEDEETNEDEEIF